MTWLHEAIRCQAWECVRVFLAASPQLALEEVGGYQAIHYVLHLPEDMIALLLASGVQVDILTIPQRYDQRPNTALDMLCRREAIADEGFALPQGHLHPKMRLLLDYGARVVDCHPEWVRAYHAARQTALRTRREAAVALYCAARRAASPC